MTFRIKRVEKGIGRTQTRRGNLFHKTSYCSMLSIIKKLASISWSFVDFCRFTTICICSRQDYVSTENVLKKLKLNSP